MTAMRPEAWIAVGACVGLALLGLGRVALMPDEPQRLALPTAGELAELERFLDPDRAAERELPRTVVVEGDPFQAGYGEYAGPGPDAGGGGGGAGEPGGTEAAPRARWSLSAIMVAGDRRVAIVDDRLVRPGDRLPDGARVAAIERDHVVIIGPGGERRRLELQR